MSQEDLSKQIKEVDRRIAELQATKSRLENEKLQPVFRRIRELVSLIESKAPCCFENKNGGVWVGIWREQNGFSWSVLMEEELDKMPAIDEDAGKAFWEFVDIPFEIRAKQVVPGIDIPFNCSIRHGVLFNKQVSDDLPRKNA